MPYNPTHGLTRYAYLRQAPDWAILGFRRPSLTLLSQRLPTHEPLQGSPGHSNANLIISTTNANQSISSPPSTTHVKASVSEATPRPTNAQARRQCAEGTRFQVSHDRGAIAPVVGFKTPHEMRAGGTRITPWLMMLLSCFCHAGPLVLVCLDMWLVWFAAVCCFMARELWGLTFYW